MVFADKGYKPDPRNDMVLELKVHPKGMKLLDVGEMIAEHTSLRRWDEANKEFPKESVKLKPKVCDEDKGSSTIWISYPREMFGHNNVADLISLYRKIVSSGIARSVRLMDIHVAERSREGFYGPRYGAEEIKRRLDHGGPYLSVVLDRSYSLTPSSQAKFAFELWMSGVDIVREDIALSELSVLPFFERLEKTMRMLLRAEKETRKKKIFVPNIISETSEMVSKADLSKGMDCGCAVLDLASSGVSALASLRKHSHISIFSNMPFSHLELHGDSGISPLAASKIARLAGMDVLDIGQLEDGDDYGMYGHTSSISMDSASEVLDALHSKKKGLKPVMPMISGSVFPFMLPNIVTNLGKDIVVDFDEACSMHPDGMIAGVRSVVQAREAIEKGISLKKYSERKKDLNKSLMRWDA